METESPGVFHKAKVEAHLALLREASEYFGIEKGRAPEYSQLLRSFMIRTSELLSICSRIARAVKLQTYIRSGRG
jgi:hypothetical protein